jgi:hypothetical protein
LIFQERARFPCGFISIEMAKIVVGSPILTQPLLLYPGLEPAMLDNIGGVKKGLDVNVILGNPTAQVLGI